MKSATHTFPRRSALLRGCCPEDVAAMPWKSGRDDRFPSAGRSVSARDPAMAKKRMRTVPAARVMGLIIAKNVRSVWEAGCMPNKTKRSDVLRAAVPPDPTDLEAAIRYRLHYTIAKDPHDVTAEDLFHAVS